MTDIIDRLKEPEAHYPGNFDTPKRANAMLSCLCQEAMEEIESLRRELAEARQEIADRKADCETGHDQDEKTIAELRQQLAASQAREQQLREALNHHHEIGLGRGRDKSHSLSQLIISAYKHGLLCRITDEALAQPQDTTALEAMIAKAGEVMRERCAVEVAETADMVGLIGHSDRECLQVAIRALPCVTLEDIK